MVVSPQMFGGNMEGAFGLSDEQYVDGLDCGWRFENTVKEYPGRDTECPNPIVQLEFTEFETEKVGPFENKRVLFCVF